MLTPSMPTQARMLATARRLLARAIVLLLALSGSGAFVAFAATPAEAAITDPFVRVFDQSITGGIQIRGNTVLSCQDAATSCASGRANSALSNNDFFMTYVDSDSDASTFDASSSTVDVPAGGSVLFAALTWGGKTTAGGSLTSAQFGTGTAAATPTTANAGQVQLKVPGSGSYTTVASTRTSFLSGTTGSYQGYADVTSAVQAAGNGSYTVANVQTATGTNIHGGWALTIAYSNPTDPPRNLTIFSGFGSVAAGNVVDFTVSGFQTPPSGTVKTTLGVVSYEGDAGSVGDQMQLGNTTATLQNVSDPLHPVANSLISVISDNGIDSSARDPKYLNQLGLDAATFNVDGVLPNGSTSAAIRLTSAASGGETYYPGVVTFATDLYTPTLVATKSVAVVKASGNTQSGVVEPGDTLKYTVDATNTAGDASVSTVLSDTMPVGTTYTPGSLTSGGTALTDATGDDVGSYNGATRKITVNAGTGASSVAGGRVNVGSSIATVTFEVVVDSGIADGASIPNTASLSYAGDLTGVAVTAASNAVTSAVVRHHSALAITKTADLTTVQRGASTPVTYTLSVTNAGPYADPAVTVTDTLPAGAVVVSATPSAGSCTTPAGTVVCDLGALANGGTRTIAVVVTLDATSGLATDTATVSGANVDSSQADNAASRSTVVNTAPVATADSGTTSGGTTTVAVLANDSDADGDTLSVTPGTITPGKGSIVVNPDRTITYTATPGTAGTDTFSYLVSDGRGGSNTATVTITIPNAPPVATPDAASTTPGDAVTVSVLANDTDPNIPVSSQSLSVSAVTQPSGGVGAVTTNGSTVTFTPSGSFLEGTATFTYTVSDGAGGTDTETVTVTVPNVGPVAADDSATTSYLTAVTVNVLANDSDDNGDPLTVTGVAGASHGTAVVTGTGSGTRVVYTPAAGWSGTDTVTYTISDGTTTTTGQLMVTTGNAAPTAGSFSATVDGGAATTIDVLAHAGDPNSDTMTVTGAGPAGHGTITVNASGGVVYTPNPTYAGPDSFSYTVSDGHGGTATATVTLAVRNQGPQANDDTVIVPVNGSINVPVLTNDTDPNADALTVSVLTPPAHGTATAQSDGTVRYVPSAGYLGADTFSYIVDDGNGGTDTATVTVDVANQSPVASADSAVASGNAGSPVTVDVLANDTDPNSDPLSIVSVSVPAHGTATVVSGQIRYTPDASYSGPDSFTYTIGDGRGGLSGATVTVDVQNRDPVASGDTLAASTAVAAIVDVLANDTDPDGETLSLLSFDTTSSQGGTLTLVGGSLRYVSAAGFTGTDTFTYLATDPRGGTDVGTVTVQVTNADPVAGNRTATTTTANAVTVDLLAGVTDADGQPVSVVSTGPAAHGTVTVDASGRATYTPAPGYAGTDTFTYTVSDGQGGFATATVTLTVADADPVTVDDSASVGYDVPTTVDVLANDSDPNIPGTGQTLTVTSVNIVTGDASVVITAGGRVAVDPDAHFAGDIVVDYVVSDGAGGSATGQLTVHVAIPGATAVADSTTTPHHTPVTIDVLANDDSGQPGANPTLVAGAATNPLDANGDVKGSVTIVAGQLRYSPPTGFTGSVTFEYTMTNPLGGTDIATVTVTVGNASPVATDDTANTPYDTTVDVDVLGNDTDPNVPGTTQTLSVSSVHLVSGSAAVAVNPDGTLRVNPDANFAGDVVAFYVVSDGAGGVVAGVLTVHVAIPVAAAVADTTTTPYHTPVTIDVLANDDSGQAGSNPSLVAGSVSDPLDANSDVKGSVTVVAGQLHYSPPTAFAGTVTFDYTMTNPLGGTDTATVTVTVGNGSPVAADDTTTTAYSTPVSVDVLANDSDPNIPGTVQTLVVTSVSRLSGQGTVTLAPAGTVTVDPPDGFAGDVVVEYVVSDGAGGTAAGQLTVHVAVPVAAAVGDNATTPYYTSVLLDVLGNDDSGQPGASPTLVAGSVTNPVDAAGNVQGSTTVLGDQLHYAPRAGFSGTVSFDYTMSNPLGGTDIATVTVTVGNGSPAAADDTTTTGYSTPVSADVLANDSDPNIPGSAQALTVSSALVVSGDASVTITADGRVTVDPDAGFAGDVVVRYVVSDGAGGTATGHLTVHVAAPVPTAVADSSTTPYGTPVTVDELANDDSGLAGADPTLVAGSVTGPVDADGDEAGRVTVVGGGLRYVPPTGYAGLVTFDYTMTNSLGGTDTGTVTIAVLPRALEERTAKVTITAGRDSVRMDPSADVTGHGDVTVVSVTQPSRGAKVTVVDGQLVVERLAGFVGTVTFEYVVVGADGTEVTVTVTVQALAAGSRLPHTGADVGLVSLAGLLLLGLGTAAVRLGRSRDGA